ncbi:MAG: D-alanine--D-alanine ligase [Pirellulales bacterium]|nr:D-alanine--D-alanine ligase [Pirellulales bacterium]
MKPLRVLALVREGLVPPESMEGYSDKEIAEWKSEFDVVGTLREMGHDVRPVGIFDDLGPIRQAIRDWSPHVAFVLLEEFHGVATYDYAVVSYLELMRQAYTGCNPIGLMLSKNKATAKRILAHHRIPTPRFDVFVRGRAKKRAGRLPFPLFVKSTIEDASLGIARASIVQNDAALADRVRFIHDTVRSDAIVEEYIDGREIYVGVVGNRRLQTFSPWEMVFTKMPDEMPRVATARVKWNPEYQKKYGITTRRARDLPPEVKNQIVKLCKRTYRALNLSGYARMDLRLRDDGRVFLIEANANPNLAYGEDFAESAHATGIDYETLLQKIITLGLGYHAPWKG